MTERTVEQVSKDIQAVEKRIENRSFIAGPSYMKAIISFELKAGVDRLEDDNFEKWNKQMEAYINGKRPAKVLTLIETTGCDGDAQLDDELIEKILEIKFDIRMNEVRELMKLKQERVKIQNIDEKRQALEMAEKGLAMNKRTDPFADVMSL